MSPQRFANLIAVVILAGCGFAQSTPAPTLFAGLLPLPSVTIAPGELCAGIGLVNAVLSGDASDPRLAWVTAQGARINVVFPSWLGARFTPKLEIVDQTGRVVARAGALVGGGCVNGGAPGDPLLILWP